MYDSLWAPHGLVRYGVAPDHPEVKVSSDCVRKTMMQHIHQDALSFFYAWES